MELKEIAKLRAERDVIESRIKAIKNRLEKVTPGYGRAIEKRSLVQLTELHEQRAINGEKLFRLRDKGIDYEI